MTEHRPWFKSYPEDVPRTLEPYPEMTVFGMLADSARRHPDKPALAWLGRHMTYKWLRDETVRFSTVLASLGVKKGDRVAFILPNSPQYVIAYYATTRLGAIAVGNNALYTQREMEHQLRDCGAKVVIVLDRVYRDFAEVFQTLGIEQVVATKLNTYMRFPLKLLAPIKFKKDTKKENKPWPFVPKDAPVKWWHKLMKAAGEPPPQPPIDVVNDTGGFIYTGGTTGPSKGAMLSHRNIVANSMQSAAWFSDLKDGEDAIMCVLPFFHSYGMTVCMNLGIYRAAKLVLVPRFELHMVLKEMQKERPTIFPGVPRLYQTINDAPETQKFDISSVKACVSGAAPLPHAVAERFHEITGGRVVEGYGITEGGPCVAANPIYGRVKVGCIGLPLTDVDVKVVDLANPEREVDEGESGEFCVKGPNVMLGYWNHPEETALAIRNGWFHTGDVAAMDEDGYFRIVDRIKEMILVSGFNVYPTEVEQVLYRHPKISKVCVVGVPSEETGEAVKAFVVLKPGEQATPEEIIKWSRDPEQGLTGYRAPKMVEFRESLPETLVGKVLRRVLLAEEKEKAAKAAAP